jgi:L-malate glycosyltransferase
VGGTEFQTLQLVKALKSCNQNVMILVYFEVVDEMLQLFEKEGVIVNCLKWNRLLPSLQFIKKLRLVFKELKPKIVHVQYMAPGALPIMAAKLAGVPRIIATVHQPYTKSHGWKAKIILKLVAHWCKPFLSVSQNAAISWFGHTQLIDTTKPIFKQASQLTLYNSIEVDRIQNIATNNKKKELQDLGIDLETIVIGTVSRMRIEKGIDLLITAFAQLISKRESNFKLLLVGEGPDLESLQQLAIKLNCKNNIIFHGTASWENALQMMAKMDIVVVPSRFEGFGLTAAEAMAMEKPIICSNAFGLCELVTHNQEGLLFQNGDTKDLQKQLEILVNNPTKAKELGKKAFLKAKQNFDYPIFLNRIKTLYQL